MKTGKSHIVLFFHLNNFPSVYQLNSFLDITEKYNVNLNPE